MPNLKKYILGGYEKVSLHVFILPLKDEQRMNKGLTLFILF
jgi:hypothetical protein